MIGARLKRDQESYRLSIIHGEEGEKNWPGAIEYSGIFGSQRYFSMKAMETKTETRKLTLDFNLTETKVEHMFLFTLSF